MTSLRWSASLGPDRRPEADLDGMALAPGLEARPVAAHGHHIVRAGDVDRHEREAVLRGEDGRARAQLADAPVARARALGEHHEAPALLEQPLDVRGRVVVQAAAVARHRHGAEEQRHRPPQPPLDVEVVGRRRDRGAPAPAARQRAQDRRRVHVARVVGDEHDRRVEAVEMLAPRHRRRV